MNNRKHKAALYKRQLTRLAQNKFIAAVIESWASDMKERKEAMRMEYTTILARRSKGVW